MERMKVQEFFDQRTFTLTYVVYDLDTKDAVIIDPVLDYNPNSSEFFFESQELLSSFIASNELKIHLILETHAHADHLSSSFYLKKEFPNAQVAIGENIKKVQSTFKTLMNLEDVTTEGSEFDLLLRDGETYRAGSLSFKVLSTPGHTPACCSYLFNEEILFVGDLLFMPDSGCGRCDFPMGSATDLYESVTKKVYTLNENVKIYVGHDYQPEGRELKFCTTVGEQAERNNKISKNISLTEFVKFREERDKQLDAPRLLLPSIQVNIRAGRFSAPESNGISYLKLPLIKRSL
ncbi:MAG: MBL fold metallo-hydrolase [Oligoflexia bacterium]|nr:MBL fold metallo-hydrolase [Oligoflexia bacterium]